MLTEEEARRRTCPVSMGSEAHKKCSGSTCMAWRWSEEREAIYKDSQEPVQPMTVYSSREVEYWPNEGYCGLAGKPC